MVSVSKAVKERKGKKRKGFHLRILVLPPQAAVLRCTVDSPSFLGCSAGSPWDRDQGMMVATHDFLFFYTHSFRGVYSVLYSMVWYIVLHEKHLTYDCTVLLLIPWRQIIGITCNHFKTVTGPEGTFISLFNTTFQIMTPPPPC